jgi:endonuclease YncB( thermonuclease family)
VVDGDGRRSGATSLRLWGLDAPELSTNACRQVRDALTAPVAGHDAQCWPVLEGWPEAAHHPDCLNRARTREDGTDLARAMVAGGGAVDWPRYACGDDADSEAAARTAGGGLWPSGKLPPDRLRETHKLR